MPVETAADRLTFLSAADFGCVFTLSPVGGGAAVTGLAGVFDNDFLEQGEGEGHIATQMPRITCRSADLPFGGREGDQILLTSAPSQPELAGRNYKILYPRPDGTGMTLLWLELV
jgi:hypothetical protein